MIDASRRRFLGTSALLSVGGAVGYHIREGKHDLTEFDWRMYLEFAKRRFGTGG